MYEHHGLFVLILAAVFMARGSLDLWAVRTMLCCGIALIIATVLSLDFGSADGSLASIANCLGGIVCSTLAVLGIAAPIRFFGAFRILGALILVRFLTSALLATSARDQGDAWALTVVVGLPCLWFAWKARILPSKRTIYVILDAAHLPDFEQWQDFLLDGGFDLSIQAGTVLRDHVGDLRVEFQGVPLEIQFKVISISQFMNEARMPDSFANRVGESSVAAVCGYRNEQERQAALVAAAALAKLSAGWLFDRAAQHGFDADDAINEALEIVQPFELHVLANDEHLPTCEQWQSAINESGLANASWESFDVREHTGFLPLTVQAMTTGFTFALSPGEFLIGGDLFPIDEAPQEFDEKSVSADFRSGAGRQSQAAQIAAATFALLAQGTVYNPRTRSFLSGAEALEEIQAEAGDSRGSSGVGERPAD